MSLPNCSSIIPKNGGGYVFNTITQDYTCSGSASATSPSTGKNFFINVNASGTSTWTALRYPDMQDCGLCFSGDIDPSLPPDGTFWLAANYCRSSICKSYFGTEGFLAEPYPVFDFDTNDGPQSYGQNQYNPGIGLSSFEIFGTAPTDCYIQLQPIANFGGFQFWPDTVNVPMPELIGAHSFDGSNVWYWDFDGSGGLTVPLTLTWNITVTFA